MAVIGSLIKGALGGYGKKPVVPQYTPVDPTEQQRQAVAGNLAVQPEAQKLAGRENQFNLQQLQSMLSSIMPGYQGMQEQIGTNIQAQLRGELPPDVAANIQGQAASRAIGGGYGGSGMHRKLVARDFGATSYQMTQQGLDSASRWMQVSAGVGMPQMMNASSMFLSPEQRVNYAFQNTQSQFQRDWVANQVRAMPDPFRAALGDAFIQDEAAIMEMAGSMIGMMGGMCWVAREVYDGDGLRWRLFRHWLLNKAPRWFRELYRKHGQRFAAWLKGKTLVKALIRKWMDTKVEVAYELIRRNA